ncbi:hypothetical protein RZO85_26295 [Raoultella ornithinolytica]|uniref:hypothetical protein n=1 Tax=Raoultella ornithinolytica TaxID=54291 RepID=UPI00292A77D2|nr:hypothetical protein [Raoultella ornithinolytica]MDV0603178.1 hypothetical protein [Raoultella ornithinolytica]
MSFTLDIGIEKGVSYPKLGIGFAQASYPLTVTFSIVAVEKTSHKTADARYHAIIDGSIITTNRFEFSYGNGDDLFEVAEVNLKNLL